MISLKKQWWTKLLSLRRHCGLVVSAPAWDWSLGRNRLWVQFLAVSDIYPMFIEPMITWVPSGFSGYIWLITKNCVKKKSNSNSYLRNSLQEGPATAINAECGGLCADIPNIPVRWFLPSSFSILFLQYFWFSMLFVQAIVFCLFFQPSDQSINQSWHFRHIG